MSEHTSGPWTAKSIPASKCHRINAPGWGELATVWGNEDFGFNAQGKANARLISAAPDLFEAAKKLDALYAWAWDTTDGGLTFSPEGVARFEEAHAAVAAALAKAIGEVPGDDAP